MSHEQISFKDVEAAIPDLHNANLNEVHVIIVGYDFCPYSKRALSSAKAHPRFTSKGSVLFVSMNDHEQGQRLSKQLGRGSRTYPLVFVRENDAFVFKGGSDHFVKYIETLKSKPHSTKSSEFIL